MAVYALVSTSYPRHRGDPGGHFVRAEAQHLAALGHEVRVLCPGSSRDDGPVSVVGCGGGEAFGWPGAAARLRAQPALGLQAGELCLRASYRLARWRDVDRIVAHFLLPGALICWPASAPVELVGHGSDLRLWARLPRSLRVSVIRRLLDRGTTFRFVAEAGRRGFCADLPPGLAARLERHSRVELPLLSVEPLDRQAIRERRRDGGRPWVALCGRLVAGKRFRLGLDVIAANDARALVIGDGPERASLERHAQTLGLSATFVGQRRRPDALVDIAGADVLLHPSRAEGAPTVVREARALGVAVLCSESGDLRRWAAGDAGIVVARDDELVGALRSLID